MFPSIYADALSLISITIIMLVIQIGVAYFQPYIKRKAENAATKEDIKNLTMIAENIKDKLSIYNQHTINLKNAEMEAVFEYNKAISAWKYYLMNFDFHYFDLSNFRNMDLAKAELKLYQNNYVSAKAQLNLFITKVEFEELESQLHTSIIKYDTFLKRKLISFTYFFTKHEIDLNLASTSHEQSIVRNTFINDFKTELNNFLEETKEFYSPLANAHILIILFIKTYIQNINILK